MLWMRISHQKMLFGQAVLVHLHRVVWLWQHSGKASSFSHVLCMIHRQSRFTWLCSIITWCAIREHEVCPLSSHLSVILCEEMHAYQWSHASGCKVFIKQCFFILCNPYSVQQINYTVFNPTCCTSSNKQSSYIRLRCFNLYSVLVGRLMERCVTDSIAYVRRLNSVI
jgi:hypothetical protein